MGVIRRCEQGVWVGCEQGVEIRGVSKRGEEMCEKCGVDGGERRGVCVRGAVRHGVSCFMSPHRPLLYSCTLKVCSDITHHAWAQP